MKSPQFLSPLANELVIDLFAGGGGASTGIEAAIGRHVDIAVNHDPEAISLHTANHPQTRHFISDVFEVDPIAVTKGQPVGALWASPDCFPAGTLVLTREGYTPIQEIQVGDEVMTHKARWRKVTETSSARRPLISLKGHGHPGISVSPEHPFLARLRKDVWNNERRSYDRTLEPKDWMPASMLDKGWYWATLTTYPSANVPEIEGRGMVADKKLLWLAGRYLGDGWTRLTDTRAEVVITCGMHEVQGLREILEKWPRIGSKSEFNELAWHERATGTTYQFTANHRGLVQWLRTHFGHRDESKRIPAWALGIRHELRKALVAGYLSADGWDNEVFSECRTVSKALAFGIKALLNTLGKTVSVHRLANTNVIQGRTVNAREIFMLRWRDQVAEKHGQTFKDGDMEWCPIREQEDLGVDAEVFNIGVEDDESYLVEGIMVHNCKHFSKAKGGTPVSKKIRGLAWVVVKWAKAVKPRVIFLENVEEFQTWGPLGEDNRPCPERKGETFKKWVGQLEALGYKVEWRELRACDYGAPTIRKRLFLVARRDGLPIVWPEPTHTKPDAKGKAPKGLKPWRTAAECIDWSIPCPSIFERKKPLADATCRRIAKGLVRYVLKSGKPFIVSIANWSSESVRNTDQPLSTVTANPKGGHHALVSAFMTKFNTGSVGFECDTPMHTVTAGGLQKRPGTAITQGLVTVFLAKHYTGAVGSDLTDPIGTVTSVDHHSLVTASLIHMGHGEGKEGGKRFSHGVRDIEQPLNTVTASGAAAGLVTSHLVKLRGDNVGGPVTEPLHTISAQGTHHGEVRAFLVKYYSEGGQDQSQNDPAHTIPTKDRLGLVTVTIAGEEWVIVDIGLRMLSPKELYAAQGFPESYRFETGAAGEPMTKTAQVRMCGNSVSPPPAEALVRANYSEIAEGRIAA